MKLTEFYDDLMPRLPGADESLVLHETLAAARELCEDGWAWPLDYGPMTIKASNPNIYLDPMPATTVVGYVIFARYEPSGGATRYLSPLTSLPETVDDAESPIAFYMEETGKMVLYPATIGEKIDSLMVSVTLVPTSLTTVFPARFKTHYRDAMIDGVCARMMLMTSKPWSNMSLATFHGRRWRNHIRRVRNLIRTRYSRSDAPWVFPQFAVQSYKTKPSEYRW